MQSDMFKIRDETTGIETRKVPSLIYSELFIPIANRKTKRSTAGKRKFDQFHLDEKQVTQIIKKKIKEEIEEDEEKENQDFELESKKN